MAIPEDAPTKYCQTCGAEIHGDAAICPECGVEQPSDTSGDLSSLSDVYPLWVWVVTLIVTIITFPFGLVVPIYFIYKGTREAFDGFATIEYVTVFLLGIIGIAVVEYGGEAGTRKFWRILAYIIGGLILLAIVLSLLAIVVGFLGALLAVL